MNPVQLLHQEHDQKSGLENSGLCLALGIRKPTPQPVPQRFGDWDINQQYRQTTLFLPRRPPPPFEFARLVETALK